jgi:hypothetical protein
VEAFRRLAETRPDAFLPDLAKSLNNQSNALSDLGRQEEALVAIDEAMRRILPRLEVAPYLLPDSGLQLAQSYLACAEALNREPEHELIGRMIEVLTSAGVIERQVDDRSPRKFER